MRSFRPAFLLSYLRAAGQILIGEDDLRRAVGSVRRAYHAVRLYAAELHGLEICYYYDLFADEVFGLVPLRNAGYYLSAAEAVIEL